LSITLPYVRSNARSRSAAQHDDELIYAISKELDGRGKIDIRLPRMNLPGLSSMQLGQLGEASGFNERAVSRPLSTLVKKLIISDEPHPQVLLFRMQWQLNSTSRVLKLKPCEFSTCKLFENNPREINTSKIKGFKRPEMNTCEKIGVGVSTLTLPETIC